MQYFFRLTHVSTIIMAFNFTSPSPFYDRKVNFIIFSSASFFIQLKKIAWRYFFSLKEYKYNIVHYHAMQSLPRLALKNLTDKTTDMLATSAANNNLTTFFISKLESEIERN